MEDNPERGDLRLCNHYKTNPSIPGWTQKTGGEGYDNVTICCTRESE